MRILVLCLVVAGCAREPARPRSIDNRGATPAMDAGAVAVDAGDSACVAQCVRDRQMVAASMAVIRNGCQVECGERPAP